MPKSLQDILDHADEIADRIERGEFEWNPHDARGTRLITEAIERRARAERDIADGVALARADGIDWRTIGAFLGTTGEAARQRYGARVTTSEEATSKADEKKKSAAAKAAPNPAGGTKAVATKKARGRSARPAAATRSKGGSGSGR